ncbi:hypothetical protein CDAR_55211 [Caerostris darwini]|uniref:Uncharacterized protein n=1 Tax=Caerostris darwini TaxID=1538125 RepID=A0AAV4PBW7_9ARAC|nr:hypothetical protein CDAR_55211 [Caerostris darwini]
MHEHLKFLQKSSLQSSREAVNGICEAIFIHLFTKSSTSIVNLIAKSYAYEPSIVWKQRLLEVAKKKGKKGIVDCYVATVLSQQHLSRFHFGKGEGQKRKTNIARRLTRISEDGISEDRCL